MSDRPTEAEARAELQRVDDLLGRLHDRGYPHQPGTLWREIDRAYDAGDLTDDELALLQRHLGLADCVRRG